MSSSHHFEAVPVPMLVITGPVGVGKTSVGNAISTLLNEASRPHALVDMDTLRACYPRPADDPFHMALGLRNLAAVWSNFRAVGAERLVVVDIVETRDAVADYETAVRGAAVQVVRLYASAATLHRRLEQRETGASLEWHKRRAVELIALMDERHIGDLLVDAEARQVDEIAREVLSRAGWSTG